MEIDQVGRITCEDLIGKGASANDCVVIDIRPSNDYSASHIPGAINIYYDQSGLAVEREIMLSALPPDKVLILYCD
jgi:rhodanese-related sulfurtransferase